MTPLRLIPALLVALLVVASCTLPGDDEAQVLSGPEIDNVMNPTTTSTTQAAGTPRERQLFFFDESTLTGVIVETPLDDDITDVLNLLTGAPEEEELTSKIPEDFLVSDTELTDEGTLRVILADDTLFDILGGTALTQAVAQIVVTATSFETDGEVEIERVLFFLSDDEDPRPVPTGDGTDTTEAVDRFDYCNYLGQGCNANPPSSTSSTTRPASSS